MSFERTIYGFLRELYSHRRHLCDFFCELNGFKQIHFNRNNFVYQSIEAHFYGLVNKVVPVEMYLFEAVQLAKEIAQMSPVAVQLAKEAINRSFETHLDEGLLLERKNFYLTFASEDQKEGMKAFIEKRKAVYKGK